MSHLSFQAFMPSGGHNKIRCCYYYYYYYYDDILLPLPPQLPKLPLSALPLLLVLHPVFFL